METRSIKFNIKQFIEEYVYCIESKDEDGELELLERFNKVFYSSTPPVQGGIQTFLFNNRIAKEYPKIQELATRCNLFLVAR